MSSSERVLRFERTPTTAHLVAALNRAAELYHEEGQRFMAKAYREASYSLTEHLQLRGAYVLLACDAVEQELRVLDKAEDPSLRRTHLGLRAVALVLHEGVVA